MAVIGGGVAGLTAAGTLASQGARVTLIEREEKPGGHVGGWDRLFPTLRPAEEVLTPLLEGITTRVEVLTGSRVTGLHRENGSFRLILDSGDAREADAVVVATGFDLFDARKKEEYGYGIYDQVITSAELEATFRAGRIPVLPAGKTPGRVAFVHCVGSRDEKAGNLYCSKLCCVTGVKQAIEIRKALPGCEVYCLYMDLRMFDRHFEELYLEAQKTWGVNFIRGRLSECAENQDLSLVLKTEDTLIGKPLRLTVDLVVLLAGFVPGRDTAGIARTAGLAAGNDGFLTPGDEHLVNNATVVPGVFLAGTVKGPCSIAGTIADARSTALQVMEYLQEKGIERENRNPEANLRG